jgi:hypothetical protein
MAFRSEHEIWRDELAASEARRGRPSLASRLIWNGLTFVMLSAGLWASVRFMIAALTLIDPSRVPQ